MRTYIHNFDAFLTTLIRRPRGLFGLMRIVTMFGHPIVVMIVGSFIILAGFWTNITLVHTGWGIFVVLGIGSLLKLVLRRSRPPTYLKGRLFASFSFPSGHTVGSTVAYGLLAYLAWQITFQPWSTIIIGLLTAIIVLIGISRVYLGAHFPSDVLAGWGLGFLGLVSIIFIIKPVV